MRAISQYPAYGIQIRPQRVRPMGDGTSQVTQDPLYITFQSVDQGGMIYEKERYQALEHFHFHGEQQYEDEATPVELIHRLSVLDTVDDAERNGWTPDDVAEIETTLRSKAVTTPNAVLVLVGQPIDPPFPTYDSWEGDADKLVMMLVQMGHNLEEVLHYERSFGPGREDVIRELEFGIEAVKDLVVQA